MRRLDALRGAIAEEVATEAKQRYRDIVGEVGDSGDEAVGAELAAMENALIGRHMQEVRDIEAALARMVVGVYDVCTDCDAEIDHHRLTAYPTCKRCAKCQALREKTFAGKGRTPL
jgi:RNA polymerase-binding transcription factor DksA